MKKIIIAFDLDGVIIDKPPLVPKSLIERLFRGNCEKKLHYRFPKSKIEQLVRKISHFYLFRPPIKQNIKFIRQLAENPQYELYIVSARYSFLRKETENWLEKRKIKNLFKGIYLNSLNEQPHLFKEKKIKEIDIDIFADDDHLIADYLAEKKIGRIFCFAKGEKCINAKTINNLSDILA